MLDERGTTLVELLVSIGVAAGILALIGTFVLQFFSITRLGADRMAVNSDLQSAVLWLGRDAAEAYQFQAGTSSNEYGSFLASNDDYQFEYQYLFDPSEGQLIRQQYQDGSLVGTNVVARFVTTKSDVVFPTTDTDGPAVVEVDITATSGDTSETQSLQLAMRAQP